MNLTAILLLTMIGAVPVEATTLEGKSFSGDLAALTSTTATVEVEGAREQIPVQDLHQLQFHEPPSSTRPAELELRLGGGSRLSAEQVELTARAAEVTTLVLGGLSIPRPYVVSIRLAKLDRKVEAAWNELLSREVRDDLVVVRKGDALDHVAGVVSTIDETTVQLLLDGSPVPIPRERVFGVILAGAESPRVPPVGRLELMNGDRLAVSSGLSLTDNQRSETQVQWGFTCEFAGVGGFIAAEDVARIDFSLGKVLYLVDEEPTEVAYPTEHELFLLDVWKYRKGVNSYSDPLQIGRRTYPRGLWIHSGTKLSYRLGREYRHFRAIAGIAEGLGQSCDPTVGLVIRGDGQELYSETISRGDQPRELDVDVSGVRDLLIEVTSTDPNGICEHLGLGDARFIK